MRQLIGRIGDRWSLLVLSALERDGLVTRRIYASVPPKVEYSLTPLGRARFDAEAAAVVSPPTPFTVA